MINFQGMAGLVFQNSQLLPMPPSLRISSGERSPVGVLEGYKVESEIGIAKGFSFGITKDPGVGGQNFGYKLGVDLASENIALKPSIVYTLDNGVILQAGTTYSMNGDNSYNLTMSYNLTDHKQVGVSFDRELDKGELKKTVIGIRYFHGNFLFQMPIFTHTEDYENEPGLMTTFMLAAFNCGVYWLQQQYRNTSFFVDPEKSAR